MKQMFIGLLVLNLLAFGWFGIGPGQSTANSVGAAARPAPPGVASLRLLGEELQPVEAEPKKTGPTVTFLDAYCFTVGPIPAKSTLRELRDLLATQGLKAEARREEYEEFSGNWVFIPPADSRAEARKTVNLLKEKGINDHLIVPSGPKRNAVSLGFFRNETAARDYFKRLQKLGFAPIMEENYRNGLRYWLDFGANESSPLSDSMIRNLDTQFEVGIKRNACDANG